MMTAKPSPKPRSPRATNSRATLSSDFLLAGFGAALVMARRVKGKSRFISILQDRSCRRGTRGHRAGLAIGGFEIKDGPDFVHAQTLDMRVLRRAWTDGRLVGSLLYPRTVMLGALVLLRKCRRGPNRRVAV